MNSKPLALALNPAPCTLHPESFPNPKPQTLHPEAALHGHVGVSRLLIQGGGDVPWPKLGVPTEAIRGRMALHMAASCGHAVSTTLEPLTANHLLCTAGSSPSFSALRKDEGLCCGSRLRKGEVFAYVGRNQNLKDLKVMVRTLLEAGADVAVRDEGRNTPLHYAAFGGFAAVAQMLLAAGADVAVNPKP